MRVAHGNTTCDACGEIVFGKKGITWVEKEHLSLKGTLTLQLPKETDFVFITNNPVDEHHFCDANCLWEFVMFKRNRQKERQKRERVEGMRNQAYSRGEGV